MKKILVAVASMMAFSVYAAPWTLSAIPDLKKETVGYIYHTSAVGTQVTKSVSKKVVAGLRMICTAPNLVRPGDAYAPLIAIFWDGLNEINPTSITLQVDRSTSVNMQDTNWLPYNQLLVRNMSNSELLVNSMKSGKTLHASWTGANATTYKVIFDLNGFDDQLDSFKNSCMPK